MRRQLFTLTRPVLFLQINKTVSTMDTSHCFINKHINVRFDMLGAEIDEFWKDYLTLVVSGVVPYWL